MRLASFATASIRASRGLTLVFYRSSVVPHRIPEFSEQLYLRLVHFAARLATTDVRPAPRLPGPRTRRISRQAPLRSLLYPSLCSSSRYALHSACGLTLARARLRCVLAIALPRRRRRSSLPTCWCVVSRFSTEAGADELSLAHADPITNPGLASGHVHTISGGSNFNLDVDFETLRQSKCTSCMVKQDMSNYWTPTCESRLCSPPASSASFPSTLLVSVSPAVDTC